MTVKKDGKIKQFLFATATVITVALVCTVAVLLSSTNANAETEGIFTYMVRNGEAIITSCDSNVSGDLTIPDTLGGYPVAKIGRYAFNVCTELTSIEIPNSVTNIWDNAFYYCTKLTSVTIPNSVTSIYMDAFTGCTGLKSVYYTGDIAGWCSVDFGDITSNPMYYANTLFISGKEVEGDLVIPDGVTNIGDRAFYNCTKLTSATIPGSVTSIGCSAFFNCTEMRNVYYIGDIDGWCSVDFGDITSNPMYYANTICINGKTVEGDLVISGSVTNIGNFAFLNCHGLTSVRIPDSVARIGDYTFSNCTGLTSVTIPDSVTNIGDCAFSDCTGLTSVTIGNSVTSIGFMAFFNTGIYNESSNWENDVLFIGNCLVNAKTTVSGDYAIKAETKVIADGSFSNCTGLISIIIPASVTNIGDFAFLNCHGLTSVRIPDSVARIGDYTFSNCTGMTNVTIPDSVTRIGFDAFSNCTGLTSVIIPDSVTSIQMDAFTGCTGLKSVTIPNSVASIGMDAFAGTDNLSTTYYIGTPEQWDNILIESGNDNITKNLIFDCNSERPYYDKGTCGDNITWTLYVDGELVIDGTGEMTDYNTDSKPWDSKCSIIKSATIGNGVLSIGNYAFSKCSELKKVAIGNSVISVGEGAFAGCTGLTEIEIPDRVTRIGTAAFGECSELSNVTIGSGVTKICWYAFDDTEIYNNSSNWENNVLYIGDYLIDVKTSISGNYDIKAGTKTIADYAFDDCFELTSVTIPNTVTNIGSYAFSNCTRLINVTIGNSLTNIGAYAFSNCKSLTYITIPDSITEIRDCTFEDCTNLKSVTLSDNITIIDAHAFYNCEKIEDVYFSGDSSKWNSIEVGEGNQSLINSNIHFLQTIMIDYCGKTESISIFSGEPIEVIESPSKEGYVFDCWLDENGEKAQIPEIMPAENIVLTAKYKKIQQTNGISVLYDEEAFGKDVYLIADDATDTLSPEVIAELKVRISGEKTWSNVYTISFVDSSGHTVKFKDGQKVTVSIPIPESANPNDKFVVHHISSIEAGEVPQKISGSQIRQENGYLIFDVTHFSYFVLCVDRTPVSIRVASTPNKTSYFYKIDNSLDLSGLAIEVIYDDGSTETVTDTALMNFSGFDSKKTGEQTVTVEYGGLSAGFTVNVKYAWWQWIIKILLLGFLWY